MKFTLKVIADIHCEVYIDGKLQIAVQKDSITPIILEEGAYCIKFVSTINPQIFREQIVLLKWHDCIYTALIKAIEQHPEWLRRCDFDRNKMNIITGQICKSEKYDFVWRSCGEKCHIVLSGVKYGVIDNFWNVILPIRYDKIDPISDDLLAVKHNGSWGIMTTTGDVVADMVYERVGSLESGFIRIKKDNKWGYINEQGDIIIAPKYKEATDYYCSIAIVSDNDSEWCVINKREQILFRLKCDCLKINSLWFQFEISGKKGLLDDYYNIFIPCEYDSIEDMGSIIVARKQNAIEYFTPDGDLIEEHFDEVTKLSKSSIFSPSITKKGNKYGCWIFGKRFLDDNYDRIIECGGAIKALKDKKWMVIEPGCDHKEPHYYDEVCSYDKKSNLTKVKDNNKWGVVDVCGDELIEPKYDYIGEFNQGIAPAKYNGVLGYIFLDYVHNEGEFFRLFGKAAENITEISELKDNIGYVKFGNKHGFIKVKYSTDYTLGTSVFDRPYYLYVNLECDEMGVFSEGLVKIKRNNKWGYANLSGEVVIPCQYDEAGSFSENRAHVEVDGKSGFINMQGEVVIPFEYTMPRDIQFEGIRAIYANFKNGIASVKKDGEWIHIDKYGHLVKMASYDSCY